MGPTVTEQWQPGINLRAGRGVSEERETEALREAVTDLRFHHERRHQSR